MKRAVYGSAIIVVLVALTAASTSSQTQRSQVRARRNVQPSGGQAFGGGGSMQSGGGMAMGGMGMMDPNMTPQQRMMQQQQEFQQRMAEMQRQAAEMQRLAEESRYNSIRQMLNAGDEQWPRIKVKLDLIERLRAEADVAADLGSAGAGGSFQGGGMGGFGGGFASGWTGGMSMGSSGQPQSWSQTWGTPSTQGNSANPSDGQVLCQQLLRDLQTPGTPQTDIVQRVAALRKIRTQAQQQLARARQDLRSLIAPAQEPALVAMGYLD